MKKTTRFKQLLERKEVFVFAGGFTCYQAQMAEDLGFEAFYICGSHVSTNLIGWPNIGVISMREMVDNAYRISNSVKSMPCLADAETGGPNAIVWYRTVQEFVRSGVAGCHLEDQESPNRCGGLKGKRLIPFDEAVGKFQAAVDAKMELDPDFQIIARSDARGAEGGSVEAVIERFRAYKKVGVDALWFEYPCSLEEVRTVRKAVEGPLIANIGIPLTVSRFPSNEEYQKLGLAAVFLGGKYGKVDAQAMWEFYNDLKERGAEAYNDYYDRAEGSKWGCAHDRVVEDVHRILKMEEKYLPKAAQRDYVNTIGCDD